MTMETLRADLSANTDSVKRLDALSSTADVIQHLKSSLWPFLESLVDEMEEIDGGLEDMLNGAEDILQFETGKLFAGALASGMVIAAELAKRITKAKPEEAKIQAVIDEFRRLAQQAAGVLEEITLAEPDEGDGEEDEEGDGEDEDDGVEPDAADAGGAP